MKNIDVGDWVRIGSDGRVGKVHANSGDRLILVIPNQSWPFPSWVHVDIDSVSLCKKPDFLKPKKEKPAAQDFEPALF